MPESCAYQRLYSPTNPRLAPAADRKQRCDARGRTQCSWSNVHEREAGDLEDHVLAWTPVRLLNDPEFKLQTSFDLRLDVFEVGQGVLNINHLLL